MRLLSTIAHLFHPRPSNNHRARVLHPEVLSIFSLLMLAVFGTVTILAHAPGKLGDVLGFASNITIDQVLTMTNQQREVTGLKALRLNPALNAAAQAKANYMFEKQFWAHIAPDGTDPWFFIKNSGYSYSVAGENLARDFSDTTEMVNAWMNSPTHKANIMSTRYQDTGIAVVNGNLLGYDTTLVVQMFGTPKVAVDPTAKPTTGVTIENRAPAVAASPVASATPVLVVPTTGQEIPTPIPLQNTQIGQDNNRVLASIQVPASNLSVPPLLTPLQILKSVFLALIMVIAFTLVYDSFVIGNRQVIRLVGHNLSHVLLLLIVAYLLISFKAGILG